MPQPTQNFLIHILLLWTTIISIIQIVIIILFFTVGHKGLDSSAVESSKMSSTGNVLSSPPNKGPVLSQGKMLTFKANKVSNKIKWTANRLDETLISEDDGGLIMKVDGYYFLNLQVTLSSMPDCQGTNNCTVSLVKIREDKNEQVLLEGSINKETHTTGILSKVEEFGAGEKLVVSINTLPNSVDDSKSKTHLDIIFMLRPQMSDK